jgi:hypothetical protein
VIETAGGFRPLTDAESKGTPLRKMIENLGAGQRYVNITLYDSSDGKWSVSIETFEMDRPN